MSVNIEINLTLEEYIIEIEQSQYICSFFFLPVLHTLPCNETLQTGRQEKSTCQELKNKDKEVWTDPRLLFMFHQIRLINKENHQARLSFFVASLKSWHSFLHKALRYDVTIEWGPRCKKDISWMSRLSKSKIFQKRAQNMLSHISEFDVWLKWGQKNKSLAWGFYRWTRQ